MAQGVQEVGMLVEMAGCGGAPAPKQGEKHDGAEWSPYPHCSHYDLVRWTVHSGESRESCLASGPTMEKEVKREVSETQFNYTQMN